MSAGWSQIWNEAQALLSHEAMELQVALALAVAIVFIMFFEGVWAVFRIPRRALFSLFRPFGRSRFQQAALTLGETPVLAAYSPRPFQGFVARAKAKKGRQSIVRNRKRAARVNRRRFKPIKPVILKNTRIEPWLLAEAGMDAAAPLSQPDAV